jgi:Type II intron maturase
VLQADHKHDHRGHRSINAAIGLKVPIEVIRTKCSPYLHHGEPIRRTERTVDTAFSIVAQFQAEFRGVAEYYKLAFNRHRLGQLKYVMERSLTKTLARKYRITPCRRSTTVSVPFWTPSTDHAAACRSPWTAAAARNRW